MEPREGGARQEGNIHKFGGQVGQGPRTDLVLSHGTHDDRAHHAGQRAHAVGDAHEDAGIARGDVQVVHVEPWQGEPGDVTADSRSSDSSPTPSSPLPAVLAF